jgi:hypothetical protein
MFTMRGIVDSSVVLNSKIQPSAFISQRKIAALTPDHWSPTDEIETCGIKTLTWQDSWDSTRLCWCVSVPCKAGIRWRPARRVT